MIRILETLEDMRSARPDWERLARRSGNALLDYDYVESFVVAYDPTVAIRVFVAESEGRVRAIAPLRLSPSISGGVLEFLDQPTREVHAGFLGESDDAIDELCAGIVAAGWPIHLSRMPTDGPETRAIRKLAAARACLARIAPASPTAHLVFDGPDVEKKMRTSSLSLLRRKQKAASKWGEVDVALHSPGPSEVDQLLEQVIEVESSGWKGRAGTGLKQDERLRAFFAEVAHRAAARDELHIGILRIGGQPAAVRLATNAYGCLWDHKIGYDEKMGAASPSVLLTHKTLMWAAGTGHSGHVFLGNHEEWQDRWIPVITGTSTVRVFPFSSRGLMGLATEVLGAAMRRLARR